jgi:DNA-binding NarL/FixJ family response regulator
MINSGPPWRTILVEDQTLLRNVLAKAIRLDDRFELLAEAADGIAARELCLRLNPDLVVTDIRLPGIDGIELASCLLKELPRVRILAMSNLKDPFTLNRLCEAGVHGYVAKDEPLEILEEAMLEVASGKNYFTAALCQNRERLRSDPTAFARVLSLREQEILCYVASGLTSKLIAHRLSLSPRSVETYRYRIMKKLDIENVAELIDYAFRNGFVRPDVTDSSSLF